MTALLQPLDRERAVPGRPIPAAAQAFIAGTLLAALVLAGPFVPGLVDLDWMGIAVFAVLGVISERYDIDLYGESKLSLSFVFMLATVMAFGAPGVIVVAPLVALAGHLWRGRPAYKLLFNAAVFLLGGLVAAGVDAGASGLPGAERQVLALAPPVLASVAYYVVNSGLVAQIVALTSGTSALAVWQEKHRWLLPHYALLGLFAYVLGLSYDHFGVTGVLGLVAPVLAARYAMKQYIDRTNDTVQELRRANADLRGAHRQLRELTDDLAEAYDETLTALAAALDARDTETQDHSQRVAVMSLAIAERLGIEKGSREWLDVKHGALLHDVGKIGVPDAILRKTGPLRAEERARVQEHPRIGYQMLSRVKFLKGAALLAYAHHERFDGMGYPLGLKGDQIPRLARIFAVADAFDAMTSGRPYRPPMSTDAACRELEANAGTQFDPEVVAVFLELVREGRFRLRQAA